MRLIIPALHLHCKVSIAYAITVKIYSGLFVDKSTFKRVLDDSEK
tara:strand:- start:13 stop:147 length:135 start_codon:yes stop_codon:yes gene_type:complete